MTIEFQCDECQRILRTADDKAGRTARCPQCGKTLTVPAASEDDFDGAPPPAGLSDFEEFTQAPPRSQGGQPVPITCPMCGEVNDSTTDRCLACGEPLDVPAAERGELPLTFGAIWNRAWEIWSANLGINLAAAVICFGIAIAVSFVLGIIFQMVIIGVIGGAGGAGGVGGQQALGVTFGLQFVQNVISWIVTAYLMVGFAQFAIQNVRTENPGLDSLLITGSRIFPIMGTMFCYNIIALLFLAPGLAVMIGGAVVLEGGADEGLFFTLVVAGMLLYFLGLMLATALFWPVPFMLADRSSHYLQGIADALKMSKKHFGLSILLVLAYFGLSLAGVLACCVGILFAFPLAFILQAVAYDRCRLSMEQADQTAV